MRIHRVGYLLAFIVLVSASGAVKADERIKSLLEYFITLMDLNDATVQIDEGLDLLFRLTPKVEPYLEDLAVKAERFHAPNYPLHPPKLDANRAFSADPKIRQGTLDDWKSFTTKEKEKITALKARRDTQQGSLGKFEKKVELVRKIKKVEEEISQDPKTMLGMAQYEAAKRAVDLDSVEMALNGIISDYKRIIREYDAVIISKESDYGAHQTVTSFLESIASEAPNRGSNMPSEQKSAVASGIDNAVDKNGAWLIEKARQLGDRLGKERKELDRIQREFANSGRRPYRSSWPNGANAGTSGSASSGARCPRGSTLCEGAEVDPKTGGVK